MGNLKNNLGPITGLRRTRWRGRVWRAWGGLGGGEVTRDQMLNDGVHVLTHTHTVAKLPMHLHSQTQHWR